MAQNDTKKSNSTDWNWLLLLVSLSLLSRLVLINWVPLVRDEILYAEAIQSQISNPSLAIHFLGEVVTWKPPLFFLVYAPFVAFLQNFVPGLEATYRLPTILFGVVNVLLVYRLIKNVKESRNIALFTAFIYSLIFLTVYVDSTVLIDTFNLTLILGALCLYTEEGIGRQRFVFAGVLTALAFFTKLWVSTLIPVLALVWAYTQQRKHLSDRYFLLSLLSFPAAALAYFAWTFGTVAQDVTPFQVLFDRVLIFGLSFNQIYSSFYGFFMNVNLWLGVGLFGFFKFWKDKPFMTVWAILSLVPFIAGYGMPWYSLPGMIPLAYFSCLFLVRYEKIEKTDTFFFITLTLLILAGYVLGILLWEQPIREAYGPEKEAGFMLAFKDNVAIMGGWSPSLAGYKFLLERKYEGKYRDFGWIIMRNSSSAVSFQTLADNYQTEDRQFDSDIMCVLMNITTTGCDYRRISNVTKPEYVAIAGFENQTLSGFQLLYNSPGIRIFKRNSE